MSNGGNSSSSKEPPTSPRPKATYAEALYSYYYNGLASVSAAVSGDQKLLDNVDTWVLSKHYTGFGTTQWASDEVRGIAYFTYRNKLPAPLANGTTHDAGWGCMHRTAQMMLAETLKRVFLTPTGITKVLPPEEPASKVGRTRAGALSVGGAGGSPQRRPQPDPPSLDDLMADPADIVRQWFCDTPDAPFGLHRIASAGAGVGVPVGTWFSPTVVCKVLESLCNRGPCRAVSSHLTVINACDQAVFRDVLLDEVVVKEKAVLLLVPVMLGMTNVSKQYLPVIHRILEMKTSVGIVGGKPKQSLYFVGRQQDQLFYLDPHVVQPAFVSAATLGEKGGPRGTCASNTIDPCMVLCFLLTDSSDVIGWEQDMKAINEMPEFPVVMVQFRTPAQIVAAAQKNLAAAASGGGRQAADPMLVEDCRFDDDDDLL